MAAWLAQPSGDISGLIAGRTQRNGSDLSEGVQKADWSAFRCEFLMSKEEIAEIFEQIAKLLELKGENRSRSGHMPMRPERSTR